MASASDIHSTIEKWLELREKLEEYTKRVEKYRDLVESYMVESGSSELTHTDKTSGQEWRVTLSSSSRESLSKNDIPSEIWEKYCKASRFRTLRVTRVKKSGSSSSH